VLPDRLYGGLDQLCAPLRPVRDPARGTPAGRGLDTIIFHVTLGNSYRR
jgi:hypothetical protein